MRRGKKSPFSFAGLKKCKLNFAKGITIKTLI